MVANDRLCSGSVFGDNDSEIDGPISSSCLSPSSSTSSANKTASILSTAATHGSDKTASTRTQKTGMRTKLRGGSCDQPALSTAATRGSYEDGSGSTNSSQPPPPPGPNIAAPNDGGAALNSGSPRGSSSFGTSGASAGGGDSDSLSQPSASTHVPARVYKDKGISVTELLYAGYSEEELLFSFPEDIVRAAAMRKRGRNARECAETGITSTTHLLEAGYSVGDLIQSNFSVKLCLDADYPLSQFKKYDVPAASLRAEGLDASKLKKAGYTAGDLRAAQFKGNECYSGKYSARELREGGYSIKEVFPLVDPEYKSILFRKGWTELQNICAINNSNPNKVLHPVMVAGYTAAECMGLGKSLGIAMDFQKLKSYGYSADDCRELGTPSQLIALKRGFYQSGSRASYDHTYSPQELQKAGIKICKQTKANYIEKVPNSNATMSYCFHGWNGQGGSCCDGSGYHVVFCSKHQPGDRSNQPNHTYLEVTCDACGGTGMSPL